MPTVLPPSARPTRGAWVFVIGESIGVQLSEYGGAAKMVQEIVARAASPPKGSIGVLNRGESGRLSVRSFAEAEGGGSESYWWDDINGTPGAVLTEALGHVAALPQAIDAVLWVQGVNDSSAMAGLRPGITAGQAWTSRVSGVNAIIAHVRTQRSIPSLPFFITMPPWSGSNRNRGYERVRQSNLAIIRTGTAVYRGAELYDLGTRDGTHLSVEGAREWGRRAGHNLALTLWGASAGTASGAFRGPSVASVTKVSATQTDVVITPEASDTLVKPTSPPPTWRLESDTAPGIALALSAIAWTGAGTNTARLTHADLAGNPVFFPCYDDCRVLDLARLVGGSVSRMPLRSYDLGWTGPL